MKLTKSKNAQEAFFYRNTHMGKLYMRSAFSEDKTDSTIDNLPFKESLARRILLRCDKTKSHKQNPFKSFMEELIDKEKAVLPSKEVIGYDKTFQAVRYFSPYGRALRIGQGGNGITFEKLLIEHYDNNKDISEELKKISAMLKLRRTYKKDHLKKSIKNNKIVFPLVINEANTSKIGKGEWLLDFINNEKKFTDYKNWYDYAKLYETKLKPLQTNLGYLKNPQVWGGLLYAEVKKYHHELYKTKKSELNCEKKLQEFGFYLNEVQDYFRHYFGSSKAGKSLNKAAKIDRLIEIKEGAVEESYMYKWIKAHITNKITALLIQNGKFMHYKVEHPTSDILSNIQIEESFKKQLFLSIAWATTRLNYFFDYGSNNDVLLGEPKNNSTVGTNIQGDILSEFDEDTTLKNIYQKNIKNTKAYMEYFLAELKKSENNNKNVFQEKVCTTFPIHIQENNSDDTIEALLDILDAAKESISYLRNNVFHPQKEYLYELTLPEKIKGIVEKDYFAKTKEVMKTDISQINSCFKEKIRSALIADVYPLEILQNLFTNCKLSFYLYAPKYELMPAFRKVYQRGANLCSQGGTQRNLSWFYNKPVVSRGADGLRDINDIKQWQAYKNLLQMIYEHSFLPAVHEDESLITKYIYETIQQSQEASRDRNKEYCFRYRNMPKYKSSSLAAYMSNLQRLQSAEESNQHDDTKSKTDNKNYYIDFVQDFFVRAFDRYLEGHLSSIKRYLLPDAGNKLHVTEKEDVETTLSQLFQKENPTICMKDANVINENDEFCLLFYPFLRMLERRELSNLQHQVIRYRCSFKHRLSIEVDSSEKLERLIAMLIFTFPDHIDEEDCYKDMVKKYFGKFVEGSLKDYLDLYFQSGEKLIQQKSMLALMRTGSMALYSEMFSPIYKITSEDYNKYKSYCQLGENPGGKQLSPIEQAQQQLASLHQELCEEKSISKDNEKLRKYKECLVLVHEYSELRRKLTFDLLYEIHLIHVDILGRFASFAADWERDMHFLLLGLYGLGQQNQIDKLLSFKSQEEVDNIFRYMRREKSMTAKFKNALKNEINRKTLEELCLYNCQDGLDKVINVRNTLAHLNHMTQISYKNEYQKSIFELLTAISKLLNYDLKRKNSVTRVLKALLNKYHIKLSLYQKNDDYECISIKSEEIVHLKNLRIRENKKRIELPAQDVLFVECVAKLLDFSYNKK